MILIRIADEALDDLHEGFWFYEAQETGLGDYFASCLSGDITGLRASTAHSIATIAGCLAGCSLTRSTTLIPKTLW